MHQNFMILVPFESARKALQNGTKIMKIWYILMYQIAVGSVYYSDPSIIISNSAGPGVARAFSRAGLISSGRVTL